MPKAGTARCVDCGKGFPAYYLCRGLCETCRIATWLPADYQRREEYAFDRVWQHSNARKKPPTGVPFLDDQPPRIFEMAEGTRGLRGI